MKLIYLKKLFLLLLLSSSVLFSKTIGKASWYGEKFHGKKTASGELFNMYDYTAAHPSYAFGTMLKVTNLSNKKSIKVRVTDRGPSNDERIIDLSFQAAKEIGMVQSGVAKVSVEKVDIPTSNPIELYPIEEEVSETEEDQVFVAVKKTAKKEKVNEKKASKEVLEEDEVFSLRKVKEKEEDIKLQIASFSTKENAEKFIKHEKSSYKMERVEMYVKRLNKTLYKVVILCDSSTMVKDILNSKKYKGAYILSKNVD